MLDELDDFTAELRLRLQDLTASLPLSVRPAAERTLEVLRRIDLQVTGLLGLDGAGCAVCGDGTFVQPRVDPARRRFGRAELPMRPASSGRRRHGPRSPGRAAPGRPRGQLLSPDAVVVPDDDAAVSGDTAGDSPIGDLGSAVDDSVGDLGSVVDDVVDDVGTLVDDVIDPSATSSSTPLQDTVDDLGDVVEDTASDLGDTDRRCDRRGRGRTSGVGGVTGGATLLGT